MRFRSGVREIGALLPHVLREPPSYWRCRRFLKQAQFWPVNAIRAWQLERLQQIVRFAYEHTEGYRELYMAARVHPRDVRALSDLRHLPFVTKDILRDNLSAFSAQTPGREYITTGGSTGIPFGFYIRRRDVITERAFIHAGWAMAGWRHGTPNAVLRGSFVGSRERTWRWDAFRRQLILSSYFLLPETAADFLRLSREHAATVIEAYPSSLNILCDLVSDLGMRDEFPFSLALLGSENVYDWLVDKVTEALPSTRLFAWYGHAEQAVLAPWCETSREYHVWPYYGMVNIVGDGGADVDVDHEGEIVATSLRLRATPFIRYRTMDRAVRGADQCKQCGRHFQMLTRVTGRAHEVIVTSTGRYISMTMVNFHDSIFDGLRQFQFRQDRAGEVTFRYIPKHPLDDRQVDAIHAGLMAKLGNDMVLHVREVETIERTPSGKYRFLDQRMNIRYGVNGE